MEKLNSFNDSNLKEMRNEINSALENISKKYGVDFNLGNISFDLSSFKTKLECRISQINGKKSEQIHFEKYCWKFNLDKSYFGKTFEYQKRKYKIIDCKERKGQYPIICKNLKNNKNLLFPSELVVNKIIL